MKNQQNLITKMILRVLLLALLYEVLSAQEFYLDEDDEGPTTQFMKTFTPRVDDHPVNPPQTYPPTTTTERTTTTEITFSAITEGPTETEEDTTTMAPFTTSMMTSTIYEPDLINCHEFVRYKAECAKSALTIYNYTKNVPPPPVTFDDWCDSLQVIVECAKEWNGECEDSGSFNEDTVAGLNHVIEFLCDDFNFVTLYKEATNCVFKASKRWGACYKTFTSSTFVYGNATIYPVHYQSHFFLCCERMRFRTCTMQVLTEKCSKKHAIVLQKFSTAVSFGDVYQDCDPNLVYRNCPGGDPRPPDTLVSKLTAADYVENVNENKNEELEPLSQDLANLTATSTIYLIIFINFVLRLI